MEMFIMGFLLNNFYLWTCQLFVYLPVGFPSWESLQDFALSILLLLLLFLLLLLLTPRESEKRLMRE